MQFKKATKTASYLRMGIVAPSGGGKTYTALRMGRLLAGPAGRIAVIDSERGSASKYSDEFEFDVLELDTFSPDTYVEAIESAGRAGYQVCIVDSLSHAWIGKDGALEQVEKARTKNRGENSYTAWRDVTPMHTRLIEAMLSAPMHVIATMRAKTEYVMEEYTDGNGRKKTKPVKVGMAPVQRDGMEYEFDLVGDMDIDHNFMVSKTRIKSLDGQVFQKPGEAMAVPIIAWLTGAPAATCTPAPTPASTAPAAPAADPDGPARREQWNRWQSMAEAHGLDADYLKACMQNFEIAEFKTARPADLAAMLDAVEAEFAPKPKPAPPARRPAPAAAVADPSNGAAAEYDGDY